MALSSYKLQTNISDKYILPTALHFPRYSLDKNFKFRVTTERSVITLSSYHGVADQPPTPSSQCPYQVITSCTIYPRQDLKGQSHYGKVKSGQTMTFYTYTTTKVSIKYQLPTPYSFHDMAQKNILYVICHGHSSKVKGQSKVIP